MLKLIAIFLILTICVVYGQEPEEICKLPELIGTCRESKPRWRFDINTGDCLSFNYGGCGGNANNFNTKEECENRCAAFRSPEIVCRLPEAAGGCRADKPRWKFDTDINKCVKFTYGGCDGNANNFMTEEDCVAKCSKLHLLSMRMTA